MNIVNFDSNNKKQNWIENTALGINWLFGELKGIYPAFKQAWPGEEEYKSAKRNWLKALIDSKITKEQLDLGLKKCRLRGGVFALSPGDFIALCKPSLEDLGIPSVEDAYSEACANSSLYKTEKNWTHIAVYHAYSMCSSYQLANSPRTETFPIFQRNYDFTVGMLLRGEALKQIPMAITHDKDSEPCKKIAKGFEHCVGYNSARKEIEKILGRKRVEAIDE